MTTPCIICARNAFASVFECKVIGNWRLEQCKSCGMVQAAPSDGSAEYDYSQYGDYLLLCDDEVHRRIRFLSRRMGPTFRFIKERFSNPVVLDFGSGAGYLCKTAEKFGLSAYGVEVSDKLIEASKTRVKFERVFERINEIGISFDAVFMMDVIEHLDPAISRRIMTEIVDHLKPGGLLIGNTPNFESANIRLWKDRDPVVAPPSHVCYFTPKTLDRYLCSFGLSRLKLYSRGLSTNSFFRKSKFERSFVEQGLRSAKIRLIPLLVFLRILFAVGGFLLQPFGSGYQVYFTYQKPAS